VDTVSRAQRSLNMASVRTRNTAAELVVRRVLHAQGFRFRLHRLDLPGKPDIVLPKHRTVVLVHGCFWHAHDCRRGALPSSNTAFWSQKRGVNMARDRKQAEQLEALGWRVLVVWECELKDREALAEHLRRFLVRADGCGGMKPPIGGYGT
jgi:DNA mismatch endonuclease (patch repair protein)